MRSGTVKEGDSLLLGPDDNGQFFTVTVGSIHRNRLPCRIAMAGQAACIAIGKTDPCTVRKVTASLLCDSVNTVKIRM